MPGPPPKDPRLRQRQNKASTRATLRHRGNRAPELPIRACACGGPQPEPKKRKGPGRLRKAVPACEVCGGTGVLPWHPQTRAAWAIYWSSEASSQWVEADLPGLHDLIRLVEECHRAEKLSDFLNAMKERRLWEMRFGLSPLDRRRLEWTIEPPEESAPERDETPPPVLDPRKVLGALA